ncbi:MAG: SRPBCC family protein [Acidimicrobiia bacterium]
MPTLQRTITTEADIDLVFAYLADFSNGPAWDPGQESSVARDDSGPSLGQIYDVMVLWGDRKLPMIYEVTAFHAPNLITLVGDGSTTKAVDTLEFVETPDGGTAVTYTADIKLKGIFRVAEPFLGSKFTELADHAEAGISRQLALLAAGEIA